MMLRAAAGAQMGMTINVDGVKLAYDDEGQGPVLLCLHAIGHGARDFEDLRARFRDRFRVLALDWPGQGKSADDRIPASAERYADLLEGFIRILGLEGVTLLGNSVGGAAAIRYAHAHPDNVRGVVLANTGGLDRADALTPIFTGGMAKFFNAGARGAWWFPCAFALYYRMVLPAPAAREQRARIVACGSEVAGVLAEAWESFGRPSADVRPMVRALQCPVFVAWAKGDRVNQLKRNLPAIRSIPGVRYETFPGGHAPFLEYPDAFARSLESFLNEIAPAPVKA